MLLIHTLKTLPKYSSPGFSVTSCESDNAPISVGNIRNSDTLSNSGTGMSDSYNSTFRMHSPSSSLIAATSVLNNALNTPSVSNATALSDQSSTPIPQTNDLSSIPSSQYSPLAAACPKEYSMVSSSQTSNPLSSYHQNNQSYMMIVHPYHRLFRNHVLK